MEMWEQNRVSAMHGQGGGGARRGERGGIGRRNVVRIVA
jgi:hypothetical protein